MTDLSIPGLPGPAAWAVAPTSAWLEGGALTIVAPPLTDIFTDPKGSDPVATSPRLLFTPDPRFTLSAHVTVDFAATFDAGVLLLWADADHHAKLCFEYSPQGEPMIVSVVTNGVSDDCNSVALARNDTHLRVTRLGPALFAFHFSEDGTYWRMVRYFSLRNVQGLTAGFSSQSPTGQGCRAVFDNIRYAATAVEDIRSGA